MGVLNYHGRILPVLDLRRRLGLPPRPLEPSDQFLLVRCGLRTVVVPIDRVEGLVAPAPLTAPEEALGIPLEGLGLMASENGITMIQDPDLLLNPLEDAAFESALAGSQPSGSEFPA
jgi:purine-binding chemotaxis protein CheW